MGKLLLAFTMFWAYIAFSQFFLIWYANITEETSYFLIRNTGNWNIAMIVLVFGHFVVPFVVLLQAWLKRNPKTALDRGGLHAVHARARPLSDHHPRARHLAGQYQTGGFRRDPGLHSRRVLG